jgi:RNA polymerase sigma-70 factor (ECF subfamily)
LKRLLLKPDPHTALPQLARPKIRLEDPETKTIRNARGLLHGGAQSVTRESTTGLTADKPAGEKFSQASSCPLVSWGGRSHRSRSGKPLRPLPPERRFNRMHNEHPVDTQIRNFDGIILPHLDAAHNLARWLVRGSDDAEDVVQEACLRAFQYFGTFRGGNARAWLLRIVHNTAIRWLEKNRVQQLATEFHEEMHSEGCEALNPEALLLQRADTQLLEQAMNHLPVRWREVLVLRELEGLSYKEIGEVVGVPIGTVMSTLFRAREQFRHAASALVRRQAQPKRSSVGDAELQDLKRDAVPV